MDSPSLQSSTHRVPSYNNNSNNNNPFSSPHQPSAKLDNRGAIHKRNSNTDRHRSISITQADRLYRLAAEHSNNNRVHNQEAIQPAVHGHWITPQHSPQLSGYTTEAHIEPFPQWSVPTPPRSDSGIVNEPVVTTGISGAQEFAFDQPTVAADMSSLGFLLPSQYAPYDNEPASFAMEPNFPPMRSQPPASTGPSAYAPIASSSPTLYQSRTSDPTAPRRPVEMPVNGGSPYTQDYRRTSNPYDGGYSVAPSQTIPSISGLTHSPLPSPHMSTTSATQPMAYTRSPSMYDQNMYAQQQSYTSVPPNGSQMYAATSHQGYAQPPFVGSNVNDVLAKPMGGDSSIRVLNQRPKPQCWEHGCNGRQFSTFSNLLRHQREKSGTASKSYCPKCGAEFTRTTARNGHLAHDKCTKPRRPSDAKP